MSSLKISQLIRDVAPEVTDIIPTVKNPSVSPLNRAVLLQDIVGLVEDQTIGTTIQGYDADTLKADVSDNLTVGYTVTPYAIGTVSSGTTNLSIANGAIQTLTNNGAFTLAAPASDNGFIHLVITNGASAGTITFSGFVTGSPDGDALDTVNGNTFEISIRRIGTRTTATIIAGSDNT